MELLLLGAGAIVLIGITLWIVWPARTADPVGNSVQGEEVSEKPMTETVRSGLAPQGDRFEDQYTSATADLSAGGVAAAVEAMQANPDAAPQAVREPYTTPVRPAVTGTSPFPVPDTGRSITPRRNIGLGAGALLALGGGVGGAWLYSRWQHERNKPINRLRRGAHDVASRISERIPDVDELPHGAAPMSGAATALLLTALVASRALHRESDDPTQEVRDRAAEVLHESVHEAKERGRDAMKRGRKQSRQLQSRISAERLPSVDKTRKPAVMGIGLGGIALIVGGAFAIWRLLHRGQNERPTWYTGE